MLLLMNRPYGVKALPDHRIQLVHRDGVTGVIDLLSSIVKGVFTPLAANAFFQTVHLGDCGQIAWSDDFEICPDAAYLKITGKLLGKMEYA
jgi:hypothetical protein